MKQTNQPMVNPMRLARESVFKVVFEYSFIRSVNERTKEMAEALLSEDVRPYFDNTLTEVISHYDELVGLIMQFVKGYRTPDRLVRTDLAVLVCASYELVYRHDIDVALVIGSAVDIAGVYGGEKSARFVNGVLAAISKANHE